MADRAVHPAGSQLIVTYRHADARSLNDAVREARHAVGELAHPAVPIGGRDYAAGDRIVFLSNDHQGHQVANLDRGAQASDVKNGTLGTIEHTAPSASPSASMTAAPSPSIRGSTRTSPTATRSPSIRARPASEQTRRRATLLTEAKRTRWRMSRLAFIELYASGWWLGE